MTLWHILGTFLKRWLLFTLFSLLHLCLFSFRHGARCLFASGGQRPALAGTGLGAPLKRSLTMKFIILALGRSQFHYYLAKILMPTEMSPSFSMCPSWLNLKGKRKQGILPTEGGGQGHCQGKKRVQNPTDIFEVITCITKTEILNP